MQTTPLTGKTIFITGATAGIGLAAASELAGRGATLLAVGRSPARCAEAEAAIRARYPQARLTFFVADLASQQDIRRLAHQVLEYLALHHAGRLDVLANNAGLVTNRYTPTPDGIELQFAVNHLAPFLLTHLLQPALAAAPGARVLTVSSMSHRNMVIFWPDPMFRRFYHTLVAYKQSKLGNVLFSFEYNRRFAAATGRRAYAIDPGLVNTTIGMKDTDRLVSFLWDWRRSAGVTPEQGAATLVHLASEPALADPQAVYWKDSQPYPCASYARRPDAAARLWALSEKLCGIDWPGPD